MLTLYVIYILWSYPYNITLDRTRGLNVSFKLHVPVPSTQPPAMKYEEQVVIGQSTQY